MRFLKPILFSATFLVPLTLGTMQAQAQANKHPEYIHALSDLRLMRGYLQRLTPNEPMDQDAQHAIEQIDAAIREIKAASIDDGKAIGDHPSIESNLRPADRYRRALEAGKKALADVDHSEDDKFANGLKHRAWQDIKQANDTVEGMVRRAK